MPPHLLTFSYIYNTPPDVQFKCTTPGFPQNNLKYYVIYCQSLLITNTHKTLFPLLALPSFTPLQGCHEKKKPKAMWRSQSGLSIVPPPQMTHPYSPNVPLQENVFAFYGPAFCLMPRVKES